MFQDYLFFGAELRMRYCFRVAHLSHVLATARERHRLNDQRACLLGDAFLGCLLLGSLLREDERFNLRFQIGDAILVSVEATCHAEIKGYIKFDEESPLAEAVDEGQRWIAPVVVRSLRSRKGSSSVIEGITETSSCSSLEVALNDHLSKSFQMNAGLRFQTWPGQTGLQALGGVFMELPDIPQDMSVRLWNHIGKLPSFKQMISQGDDPDSLVSQLSPDPFRAINNMNPRWQCTCSRETVENLVRQMVKTDPELRAQAEPTEVSCDFCGETYVLTPATLT